MINRYHGTVSLEQRIDGLQSLMTTYNFESDTNKVSEKGLDGMDLEYVVSSLWGIIKEMRHERSELMGQLDMMEMRLQTDVNNTMSDIVDIDERIKDYAPMMNAVQEILTQAVLDEEDKEKNVS